MANKITKREIIKAMLEEQVVQANETYMGFLTHELELLDNKSANRKPTKNQADNVAFKRIILATMAEMDRAATVSEIQAEDSALGSLSNQRVSALIRQLVEEGKVIKSIDKKRTLFALVPGADNE